MNHQIKTAKRRWWIAGLFSYLVPGLGQAYNGRPLKGLLFNFILSLWGGVVFSLIFYTLKQEFRPANFLLFFLAGFLSIAFHIFIIFDAIRFAKKQKEPSPLQPYNKWIVYLAIIIISLTVDFSVSTAIRENVIKPYRIPAASMEPTLLVGDFLLSNQLYYNAHNPKKNDLIIFKYPLNENIYYIKRIIAAPGDTLKMKNKNVYINGNPVAEPYTQHIEAGMMDSQNNIDSVVIPEDEYFVMGDNWDNSSDSRHWGNVKRHQIIGKPIVIYWSWNGRIPAWKIFHKLFSIRFGRIGKVIT